MQVKMFFKDLAEIYTEFSATMVVWSWLNVLQQFGYI